jgi:hypothetical protein
MSDHNMDSPERIQATAENRGLMRLLVFCTALLGLMLLFVNR